jgi:hypothetical protein
LFISRFLGLTIVVNHLTRMRPGFICAAGIDMITGQHIRPVLPYKNLETTFLKREGGIFAMGEVLRLGRARAAGIPPEIEDYYFDPAKAKCLRTADDKSFWDTLMKSANEKVHDLFGPDLKPVPGGQFAVEQGKGSASLGCLRPASTPRMYLKRREGKPDQIRISFEDGTHAIDASLTDLRFYGSDYVTADPKLVDRANEKFNSGAKVILSVGLTRAFASSEDQQPLHWLQVNNVHFADKPLW